MNIFDVLCQGKARLHEPSISAMLGYLLSSRRNHGLGDTFLRAFLSHIQESIGSSYLTDILDRAFIDTTVTLEEPYALRGARRDIDIQISINNANNEEECRIIVENKIRATSGKPAQLKEYYEAVVEDDESLQNLIIVFITPKSLNQNLADEFDNLNPVANHHKTWLYWNDDENSVVSFVQNILHKDSRGEITPLNEYIRHTLKAFVLHIRSFLDAGSGRKIRSGEDIGEIIDERSVTLADGKTYLIVRRDSRQIQVFLDEEKVEAKMVLRQIIKERQFDIPLRGNTRAMGAKVLSMLPPD